MNVEDKIVYLYGINYNLIASVIIVDCCIIIIYR